MIELTNLKSVSGLVAAYQVREDLQYNGEALTPHQYAVVRYLVAESLNDDEFSERLLRQNLEKSDLISIGWQNGYYVIGDADEFINCSFFNALTPEQWFQKSE
jgi:hypothetical protein